MQKYLAYLLSFFIMVVVMWLPHSVTQNAIRSAWYTCIRPDMTPPNYVFPIVWTLLYITIGVGLAETLLLKTTPEKQLLLVLYTWNLFLNVLWSFVYFGTYNVVMALFVVLNLLLCTLFLLYYTYLTLPVWIFWMLLPYLAWLFFASWLNFISALMTCS